MPTAIDLFAGLGGWSTGARNAGVNVLWAANHWPIAVEWHSASYREDHYEKAADHLLRIYKERFISEAAEWLEKPRGHLNFERDLPHITPERVSQFEYNTEWFPAKP